MFTNEFKAALQKWCNAYNGHLTIRADDVLLDQFNSVLGHEDSNGSGMYTFIIDNDITLTFQERNGKAGVCYFGSKESLKDINSIPSPRCLIYPCLSLGIK